MTCPVSCRQAAQSQAKQAAKDSANKERAEKGGPEDVTQGVANSNINSKTFK